MEEFIAEHSEPVARVDKVQWDAVEREGVGGEDFDVLAHVFAELWCDVADAFALNAHLLELHQKCREANGMARDEHGALYDCGCFQIILGVP